MGFFLKNHPSSDVTETKSIFSKKIKKSEKNFRFSWKTKKKNVYKL